MGLATYIIKVQFFHLLPSNANPFGGGLDMPKMEVLCLQSSQVICPFIPTQAFARNGAHV